MDVCVFRQGMQTWVGRFGNGSTMLHTKTSLLRVLTELAEVSVECQDNTQDEGLMSAKGSQYYICKGLAKTY